MRQWKHQTAVSVTEINTFLIASEGIVKFLVEENESERDT